jgi:hypothetical protein
MLVIMMSPSISDAKHKMTAICEQKKRIEQNQHMKKKTKKYLESPELDEFRVKTPQVSNYNGTSCRFLTLGKTKKKRRL